MIIVCASCGAKNRVPEEKLTAQPSCGQCHQPLLPLAPIELNEQNFSNYITNSDLPILIDLWAEWCGPCKMIAPVLEELAGDYDGKADILKLDVDENPSTAAKYEVMSIPTLIVFKDGEAVDKVVGFQPKENLAEVLDKHL